MPFERLVEERIHAFAFRLGARLELFVEFRDETSRERPQVGHTETPFILISE
jgi:hypothetical protein